MNDFLERQGWALICGTLAACILTCVTLVIALYLGHPMTALEVAAVFTSYGSTVLFVLQMRQCYLWGVVTTLLYAELFRQSGLYGSAVVQLYLLGALAYGYFRWGPDGDPRPVTRVRPLAWWLAYLTATGTLFAAASWTSAELGSPVVGADAAILALSILAQWLLDNKKLETWAVWAMLNAVAVYLYWTQGLTLVALQYVYFLGNAVWGFVEWRRSMIESAVRSGDPMQLALRQGREIGRLLDLDYAEMEARVAAADPEFRNVWRGK